jgi:hypothetical protein
MNVRGVLQAYLAIVAMVFAGAALFLDSDRSGTYFVFAGINAVAVLALLPR